MTFKEFAKKYYLLSSDHKIISDVITKYVTKRGLLEKDWSKIDKPYSHVLQLLGNDEDLVARLIFACCDEELLQKDLNKPSIKSKEKKARKKYAERQRKAYLNMLKNVTSIIKKTALNLRTYKGGEENPLSANSLRKTVEHLELLYSAEVSIDSLKKEDQGRRALYAFDHVEKVYRRIGIAVNEPTTVFALYVVKYNEQNKKALTIYDGLNELAQIIHFWKFGYKPRAISPAKKKYQREAEDFTPMAIEAKLFDRINYYKLDQLKFISSGWEYEYHPMIYIDKRA